MNTTRNRGGIQLGIAALALSVAAGLAGCTFSAKVTPDPTPEPTQDSGGEHQSSGTQPSGIPDDPDLTPEEANAISVAGVLAAAGREWLTKWDGSGCTGQSAAEDVRECQILLMDLADEADGIADLLEEEALVLPALADAADAARTTADAATAWLDGWCGAYADAACAEPGEALVDAQRAFDTVMDAWRDRDTPDA